MVTDVRTLYARALGRLRVLDAPMAPLEARELTAAALRLAGSPAAVPGALPFSDACAPDGASHHLDALLARRDAGEPLAHLLGEWDFYGLTFRVSPDVLIPRPDTETLVEHALGLISDRPADSQPVHMLDLCCGSGCIGITLLVNASGSTCLFGDISAPALRIAQDNARRHAVVSHASFASLDALSSPPTALFSTVDLLLCNPPYIPDAAIATLDASVRDYEPHLALDGGTDGLAFYRSVAASWRGVLADQGVLLFECGFDQADAVCTIAEIAGFQDIHCIKDLTGIRRVVACRHII